MATRHKRKTNPCEGCRERKKKCSTGQPCERCKRLGITCHYIKQVTPPTVDYLEMISNQELQQDLNELEQLMNNMEKELQVVRTTTTTTNSNSNKKLKSDSTYQPNWQFSIGPLGVTIHTDITSIQGLLFHVQALGALSKSFIHPTVPTHHFYNHNNKINGFLKRHLLASILRRGNHQAMINTVKLIQQSTERDKEEETIIDRQIMAEQERAIMRQLVQIYFTCQSYNSVLFHEQTFRRLFINNVDIINSPVACALCSVVLTMHCKHALRIISYDQQMKWATHFFTCARHLISMEFDTVSLETVITYYLMAFFKANVLSIEESKKYLDMSLRIRQLLEDDIYNVSNNIDPGEYETFKRLHKGLLTLRMFMQFLNRERGVPTRGKKYMVKVKQQQQQQQQQQGNGSNNHFRQMIQSIPTNYVATPLPDESIMIGRVIIKESHSKILSQSIGRFIRLVRCGEDDKIPLSLIVQTEENLKKAYFEKIPVEYQLPSSIFEDDELDDLTFWEMLKNDKRCDLASVSLATQYYQILLSIHEPFLPVVSKKAKSRCKLPAELSLIKDDNTTSSATDGDSTDDDEDKGDNNSTHSSQNKSQYSQSPSQAIASEDEDDDDDDDNNDIPSPILSTHSLRAQSICFKAAVTVIRLLEYQCTMLPSCTIPRPILLSVWDICLRNGCLGMSEDDFDLTPRQVQVAREYAIRCIGILKRGCLFNAAERQIWEYYQNIEDQLLKALYGPDSPPTANYFEPANSSSTPQHSSSCC